MSFSLQHRRVHLASRSPRRRELLAQIGVGFDTIAFRDAQRGDPELDETPLPGEEAAAYVERVARNKASLGWRIVNWRGLLLQPVLAADTSIEMDGELIGKPLDVDDAQRILRRLSGRTHRVLTAVAVSFDGRSELLCSLSEVRFRELDDDEIARYVASGEPMDKAGAYGIQGRAAMFIEHIAGSYTGVMGLPLCETAQLLKRFGYPL
ncbi:MAG: Maf-like protein YhdE [Candidatus Accumulibacter regalis]|jgi:septum formation protein|uniref:dTTP/UTP pyrophosphatase n=1 Tax=Accumulibacter regalis TaxID=522306 RepID=A0A011P1M1_ACCRE|nr:MULTISPECIES: Maf family protein [unclassified Candidatus Accumulibacter]EXI88888.1 MAG: Maf-like protein YhdE [Candidatus Accumulibacter regalis]MQM35202.1 septum formation inhibitor Maf [Candidatus Accumulibacter phosphatis]MBL8369714.1 septum formation inhibitor Maf [Accumulibacter sp.]MBN8512694.1 septum formation inhibitor Maf [Accumulibacter sp.]MBO3703656.1 septum formation inhibitor Maf [Accumulibacter sp.]